MDGVSPYGSPYPVNTGEIDLREEFSKTLYGSSEEVPKGRLGLLRKMRRNTSGDLIKCTCRSEITEEPDQDFACRSCRGMGYYWDEKYITYFEDNESYKVKETLNKDYLSDLIYLEHNVDVTNEDYIVSIRTDSDGNVIIPIERLDFYKIYNVKPFRSDKGRIEFYTARTRYEQKWSVWYGVKR